ncbi:tetratricopeptide repeat protein [Desulfocurvus sp.]|uniref:tetratricopeptide repeat protein n=1 Tax=Desulfocurvus sp. TaxID=2871698 RepID=UPI0025BF0E08|nr:tetratricopeptide repeat protein [Desulfocurvus sp.]MCK9240378.1 tetratricopeptide repeat protein [Desulfocurvus sp.]
MIKVLLVGLSLVIGAAAVAHAWGLPVSGFNRHVDAALQKERWSKADEAKEHWRQAAELGEELLASIPDRAAFLMGTARAYYGLGDYAKSVELYERMIRFRSEAGDPDPAKSFPWVYVYLGLAYAKSGDAAKAVQRWQQVGPSIGAVYGVIESELARLGDGVKKAEVQ